MSEDEAQASPLDSSSEQPDFTRDENYQNFVKNNPYKQSVSHDSLQNTMREVREKAFECVEF